MGTKAGKLKSEVVKKTDKYSILKKRSGKYAVLSADKKWINGAAKIEILVAEALVKAPVPKKEEAPAEEPKAEEASSD